MSVIWSQDIFTAPALAWGWQLVSEGGQVVLLVCCTNVVIADCHTTKLHKLPGKGLSWQRVENQARASTRKGGSFA